VTTTEETACQDILKLDQDLQKIKHRTESPWSVTGSFTRH